MDSGRLAHFAAGGDLPAPLPRSCFADHRSFAACGPPLPPPQAGSAEDWGTGVALPDRVLRRASVTLENLSHVVRGDQEVRQAAGHRLKEAAPLPRRGAFRWIGRQAQGLRPPVFPKLTHSFPTPPPPPLQLSVADFLADGDHVTRMLKDWGDGLDRRLPPPHLQQPPQLQQQQQAGGHDSHHGHHQYLHSPMAPADVRACITTLRCILLLTKLTRGFIGRFLPQVGVTGRGRGRGVRGAEPACPLAPII